MLNIPFNTANPFGLPIMMNDQLKMNCSIKEPCELLEDVKFDLNASGFLQ